jgi:succinate dehydrogenase / fumarate reductase cytochrome b subunit
MSTLAAVTRQNRAPSFWGSTIGKKIVMAVTGILMFVFVIGHLLGNLQVFEGPAKLNAYGAFLHSIGELLWPVRAILLIAIALHITATVQLALRNKRARPLDIQLKRPSRPLMLRGPCIGPARLFLLSSSFISCT